MNITSAQWVSSDENEIYITVDGEAVTVPTDSANRHYAEILSQVEAGTLTIADAD